MSVITTWLPIIQDVITIGAVIVGAYVALVGLNTWKEQIRGNAEYDLARRVLKAVYKVRDTMRLARISAYGIEDVTRLKERQEPDVAKLAEATASLQVELLEAEAVWGDTAAYDSLISFTDWVAAFEMAYYIFYFPRETKDLDRNSDAYRILFDDYYGSRDGFWNQVESTIQEVEDFLRPKLKLKEGKVRKKKAAKPSKPKRP